MKRFVIRCLVNEGANKGAVLGYIDFDSASGGYPYATIHSVPLFTHSQGEAFMHWIADKTEMSEYSSGGMNFPNDAGVFRGMYRQLHQVPASQNIKMSMRFELIEVDMTDILFVKSKIAHAIEVEGLECEDWKTRDKAYYKIVTNQLFN